MKMIVFLLAIIGLSANVVSAQEKTASFKVYGKCGMCKARIEKAAKSTPVTSINWDSKTKVAKVIYDPSKVSLDTVQKKIALAGHDTEKFMATDEAYDNLPGCCHYERMEMTAPSSEHTSHHH